MLGVEFGHGLDLHVAALQLPLVVLLQQDGPDEPDDGLLAVADACGRALAANTVSKDVVLSLLSQEGKRPEEAVVVLPQKLMLNQEPVADCSRYDKLLQETRHVA